MRTRVLQRPGAVGAACALQIPTAPDLSLPLCELLVQSTLTLCFSRTFLRQGVKHDGEGQLILEGQER